MTTETSKELHAQAQELRDRAEQLRAQQQTVLATAQQEADRLHAEADRALSQGRNEANALHREALETDDAAAPVQQRAHLLEAAEQLAVAIPAAETRVVELYSEAQALGETIDTLQERLDELGVEREETGVRLATAREAGDVDTVTAVRIRLSAVDEVVAALEGQKRAADRRVVAIGDPSTDGDLAKAAQLTVDLRARQRQVLNELDPTRLEAVADAMFEQIQQCVEAQFELPQEQQSPAVRRPSIVIN